MINRLLTLLIFSSISLFGYCQDENIVQKGHQVPDFVINMDSGKSINFSDYKGSVVLINFFATWCGPCKMEMPLLQNKVWLKFKDNKKFKLMSIGRGHSLDEVTNFKTTNNLDFPIFPDKDKSIYNKFASGYIPRNYIIDSKGEVVYMSVGFSNEEFNTMLVVLDNLLKE